MIYRTLFALAALILASATAAAQNIPAPSIWVNQRGSILTIDAVSPEGKLTGKFVNKAAGTGCLNTDYNVTGRVKGRQVFFVVTFTTCNTVTVWRGWLTGSTIATRFRAAYPDNNGRMQIWRGKDTFNRQ